MKSKSKKKEGIARLFELAGPERKKLTFACLLSIVSAASRIIFFFAIYGVIREVVLNLNPPSDISIKTILIYSGITLAGIIFYGLCGYSSSSVAHKAAYRILYEIRIKLMEKMSRISLGYFTSTTQGAIKKILVNLCAKKLL